MNNALLKKWKRKSRTSCMTYGSGKNLRRKKHVLKKWNKMNSFKTQLNEWKCCPGGAPSPSISKYRVRMAVASSSSARTSRDSHPQPGFPLWWRLGKPPQQPEQPQALTLTQGSGTKAKTLFRKPETRCHILITIHSPSTGSSVWRKQWYLDNYFKVWGRRRCRHVSMNINHSLTFTQTFHHSISATVCIKVF